MPTPAARLAASSHPDLAGRVAVVTGGSRGIGAATAQALAANGAVVAVVGRDEQALGATTREIEASGGRALAVRADVTSETDVERLARTVVAELGTVDALLPFAGGNGMPVATAQETAEHWRSVIDSDLTPTFLTIRAFLPSMIERGAGSIVTMASAAARQPSGSSAAYAAAKAGVIAFTRHLANEVAADGIRANCIAPSAVENDKMRTRTTADQRAQLGASFPLRRIGQPADVAAAALFLTSSASAWITGTTLDVAGGKIML